MDKLEIKKREGSQAHLPLPLLPLSPEDVRLLFLFSPTTADLVDLLALSSLAQGLSDPGIPAAAATMLDLRSLPAREAGETHL